MRNMLERRNFILKSILGVSSTLALNYSIPSERSKRISDDLILKMNTNRLKLNPLHGNVEDIVDTICKYLLKNQVGSPGEYFGSVWSEKAYHGPLLDYHAGGAHHHRGAGSAGLVFSIIGNKTNNAKLFYQAEHCFDWLSVRQHERGGFFEIQNNDVPSNWEGTSEDECSTISTAFAIHGLGNALLLGLPPKKQYMDCIYRAAMWQLGTELVPNSGIFPHHERSPWDTLNANMHAAETLALSHLVLDKIYGKRINIFKFGAQRAIHHTLECQWENGCFPYRSGGHFSGVTINYTSLVLWCLFNVKKIFPELLPENSEAKIERAMEFLVDSFDKTQGFLWEDRETTTAKYNFWTYAITANVLSKSTNKRNNKCAHEILEFIVSNRTESGLLPMRDRGEIITECAFMQADMALFLMECLE